MKTGDRVRALTWGPILNELRVVHRRCDPDDEMCCWEDMKRIGLLASTTDASKGKEQIG